MFTKGEYVVYEQKGVCRVEGFEARTFPVLQRIETIMFFYLFYRVENYMFLWILPKVRCGKSFPVRKLKN